MKLGNATNSPNFFFLRRFLVPLVTVYGNKILPEPFCNINKNGYFYTFL